MLIKYKNKMITLRELCIELKINYDKFYGVVSRTRAAKLSNSVKLLQTLVEK